MNGLAGNKGHALHLRGLTRNRVPRYSYSMFQKPTVCQGMTSVVPKASRKLLGFSPCRTEADFPQTIFETRSKEHS